MASKIENCNIALQDIGVKLITSLDEGSPQSQECVLRYDLARRSLLAMHPWKFATRRFALNLDVEVPVYGYTYQYQMPSDFLHLIRVASQEYGSYAYNNPDYIISPYPERFIDYKLESTDSGLKLLSNSPNEKITYVADVSNEGLWDARFTILFSKYLSWQIAYKLAGSEVAARKQAEFDKYYSEFKMLDSQQNPYYYTANYGVHFAR
jgi:hypothetical protein